MVSLLRTLKIGKLSGLQRSVPVIYNAVRNHWHFQYKPGPYPHTAEERAAAAKRYGIPLEKYETYPEEEGFGDYPKLPDIGYDSLDPYYPWDLPEQRRNFNEPIHASAEIYGGDRYDPAKKLPIPLRIQWAMFLGTIAGFGTIYYFLEDYKMGRPVIKKQYPSHGNHYTFDAL